MKTLIAQSSADGGDDDPFEGQGWVVADYLARLWLANWAGDSFSHLKQARGVGRLPLDARFAAASDIAARSGVQREAVMRIFNTGSLPSIATLVKIFQGCERKLVLKFQRDDGSGSSYDAVLVNPNDIMPWIGRQIKHMRGVRSYDDLRNASGIRKQTIWGAEEAVRNTTFKMLFQLARALGYQLKFRFRHI
jgi:transcriptional regulator with XRE-family HTH domain